MSYSHPRFIICEDGAFKLLDIYHNTIVIKNTKENGKIIIDLSSITEIIPIRENKEEVSVTYISNGLKKTTHFTCQNRLLLLNKIITMKDRSSKIISDYSIETFKCYLMINLDEKKKIILKKIGKLLSDNLKTENKNVSKNSPTFKINDFKVYCTLYRTYMSSTQLTNKELKNYYIDLNQIIKIKIAEDIYALILENINKIDIAIVPLNKNDLQIIKDLIISYADKYLCYEIKYQEKDDYLKEVLSSPIISIPSSKNIITNEYENKILEKNIAKLKLQNINELVIKKEKSALSHRGGNPKIKKKPSLFGNDNYKEMKVKMRDQDKKEYLFVHYNVNRIGYNENKLNLILKSNSEYINLFSINNEKIAQIKISDIFAIIINGSKENYFEIILEDKCKSRFIFEVERKNNILNDIIELLLKYRKDDEKFLILSYKIHINSGLNTYQQEGQVIYEDYLIEQIKLNIFQKDNENLMIILEEIILNFFLKENSSRKIQDVLLEYSDILIEKFEYYYQDIIYIINDKTKDDNKKQINYQNDATKLNLLLILFKNLGMQLLINVNGKAICNKLFEILSKELKDRYNKNNNNYPIILNDYALFYNTIHILEYFMFYKQMMFLKILSFEREIRLINLEQENDLDSMFINTLLIIFENKLNDIKELPDIFIPESSYYYFLFILYKIFLNESSSTLRNGISLLSKIFEKLGDKKQRELKEVLLKKTLILFILIKIFIVNNNNDIIITKNCIKLFQILIYQYYEMTIPIKNLFPNTLIKIFGNQKEPDKWDKKECEKFFYAILKDYSEEKIIWNSECKKELVSALTTLIDEYEKTIKKRTNYNLDNNIEGFNELIDMVLNTENYNNLIPDDLFKRKYIESKAFYDIDYKNFKVSYKTLKKEVYILDIYINQLIKDNKKEINIQKPFKFWKKLKKELINNNEEKRISILKVMILVYKKYFSIIGEFDYYNIVCRIYKASTSDKIRALIIELFNATLSIDDDEIKQNNNIELSREDITFNIKNKLNLVK